MRRFGAGIIGAAVLGAAALAGVARAAPVQVRVEAGALKGAREGAATVFRGIPYAAPPVGPLRWRPPEPAAPWTGVRPAEAFGAACPQPHTAYNRVREAQSEDCLFLNVWTPAAAPASAKLPVMVWVHGGGYVTGSGAHPAYGGQAFARDGVILVTLNYRLGALGFFAHPALTKEAGPDQPLGDYGLMDQVAALGWVKRNIAAFGGDPSNVTLFGESAGGGAVLALLAAPSARGLFAKAIVESGPGFNIPATLTAKEAQGAALAARAGAPADATAAQLRALAAESLLPAGESVSWGPIVDGRFLPVPVEAAFATGKAWRGPLIIGTNTDEGSLLSGGAYSDAPKLIRLALGPDVAALRAAYAAENNGAELKSEADFDRLMFADFVFGAPSRWFAGQASRTAPAWLYRFGYVPAAHRAEAPGAWHSAEIPYVFDTLEAARGTAPPPQDQKVADRMHSCWVAFAKSGAPACRGGPAWPAYAPERDPLLLVTETGEAEIATGYRKGPWDVITRSVMSRFAGLLGLPARR